MASHLNKLEPDPKLLRKKHQLCDMMKLEGDLGDSETDSEEMPLSGKSKAKGKPKSKSKLFGSGSGGQGSGTPQTDPPGKDKFSWEKDSISILEPSQCEGKAKKLIQILSVKELALKDSYKYLKSSAYGTPKKLHDLQAISKKVEEITGQIKSAIDKSLPVPKMKQLLITGCACMKDADAQVKKVKAVLKAESTKAY